MKTLLPSLTAFKNVAPQFGENKQDNQLTLFKLSDESGKGDVGDKFSKESAQKANDAKEPPVIIECGTMGENSDLEEVPPEMLAPPSPDFIQKLHFVLNFLSNFLAGVAEFLSDIMTGFKNAVSREGGSSFAPNPTSKGTGGYL